MSLLEKRNAIQHLLAPQKSADARAWYYAFNHPDYRTQLYPYHPATARAIGYVAISQTGIDLFRPLVTMRLPWGDWPACQATINQALPAGRELFLSVPAQYESILPLHFEIFTQETLIIYTLKRHAYQPILNVLVSAETDNYQRPRYVIRQQNEIVSCASIAWVGQHFTEISVQTDPAYRKRGWGRDVVVALVGHLLDLGKTPLYATSAENENAQKLATSVGFTDSGHRELWIEGRRLG